MTPYNAVVPEEKNGPEPVVYHFNKPKTGWMTWFKKMLFKLISWPIAWFVKILVFPAPYVWNTQDTSKYPQHRCRFDEGIKSQSVNEGRNPDCVITEFSVEFDDGPTLNGLELKGKNSLLGKPWVIWFQGNGGFYDNPDFLTQMINNISLQNSVAFNYRGVGKSTGTAQYANDLCTDGIAQVQRLLDQGIPANQIILYGHSLGGAVATRVAQYFHGKGLKVKLFNDRSFSNLTHVMVGHIRGEASDTIFGKIFGFLRKVLGYMAHPIIKTILVITQWEIEAARSYDALPEADKAYVTVQAGKDRSFILDEVPCKVENDPVITRYGALHNSFELKTKRRAKKSEIRAHGYEPKVEKALLAQIKTPKLLATSKSQDAHTLPLLYLYQRNKLPNRWESGRHLWLNFLAEVTHHRTPEDMKFDDNDTRSDSEFSTNQDPSTALGSEKLSVRPSSAL